MHSKRMSIALALVVVTTAAACHKKPKAPVARPLPPPPAETPAQTPTRPPEPPAPAREPVSVPAEPTRDDAIASAPLDVINKNSPLKPVYFALDSAELTPESQKVLDEDGALLKRYGSWTITIEGHCDERGTAEYNLALGERRAVTARTYLVSIGIAAERLRTVSYGKEFPFDAGHDETAWSKNRRAHFVVTAK